jgi:molybdopterin synthase sulfur carrier subunit
MNPGARSFTVLYFARLREAIGRDREQIEPPAAVRTLGQLRSWLQSRGEPWAQAFAEVRGVRMAIDQAVGSEDTPLRDGAEIAFFPPVTGG